MAQSDVDLERREDQGAVFFNPSSYRYVASAYVRVGWLLPMYLQVPPDVPRVWPYEKKTWPWYILSLHHESPSSSSHGTPSRSSSSSSWSSFSSFACRAAKTDVSTGSVLTFFAFDFALLFFWHLGWPWPLPFSFRQPNLNRCKRWCLRFKGNKENLSS